MWSYSRLLRILGTAGATLLASLAAGGSDRGDDTEVTAVFASVYNGYERTRLPDGSFAEETYSFGEGGFSGIPTKDRSLDPKSFREVAARVAPGLERQGYVPSFEGEKTKLLILVYWGATGTDQSPAGGYDPGPAPITPPPPPPLTVSGGRGGVSVSAPPVPVPTLDSGQTAFDAMASVRNRQRDRDNARNARILGYEELLARNSSQPAGRTYQDLVEEIEDTRYFVVLRAYDFQLLWKQKKKKLLWEVRYSMRARNHLFDEDLGAMTDLASRYFGRSSDGLVRKEVPLGRVRLAAPVYQEVKEPAK